MWHGFDCFIILIILKLVLNYFSQTRLGAINTEPKFQLPTQFNWKRNQVTGSLNNQTALSFTKIIRSKPLCSAFTKYRDQTRANFLQLKRFFDNLYRKARWKAD